MLRALHAASRPRRPPPNGDLTRLRAFAGAIVGGAIIWTAGVLWLWSILA